MLKAKELRLGYSLCIPFFCPTEESHILCFILYFLVGDKGLL